MTISREEFKLLVIPRLKELKKRADAPDFERTREMMTIWSLLPQNNFKCTENHTSVYMAITYILDWVENDKLPDFQCQYIALLQALGISVPS